MKKNINTTALLGAGTKLGQLIDNHKDDLTTKGVKPEDLKEKVATVSTDVQKAEQESADARTASKNATQKLNTVVANRYPEFSSVIDLLRGAVGNRTELGKQLTNIRKAANKRGRSSTANDDAKAA